jgi:hypothetical protein
LGGISPVTADGYVAAVYGGGIRRSPTNPGVNRGLVSFSLSLVAGWGLRVGDAVVSPLLIYHYVLGQVRDTAKSIGLNLEDETLRVWAAAAVFVTLENSPHCNKLLSEYVTNSGVSQLFLKKGDSASLIPCDLELLCTEISSGSGSLPGPNEWERKRAPNYWAKDRGVYPASDTTLQKVLDQLVTLDQERLFNEGHSLLLDLIVSPNANSLRAIQIHDLLMEVGGPIGDWEKVMKSIFEGAMEALGEMRLKSGAGSRLLLFPHNCEGEIDDAGVLVVPVSGSPLTPQVGDQIVYDKYRFTIRSVREENANYLIEIDSANSGASNP